MTSIYEWAERYAHPWESLFVHQLNKGLLLSSSWSRSINTPYSGLSATKAAISPAISNVMTVGMSAMRQLLQLCVHEAVTRISDTDTTKKLWCGLVIKDAVVENQEISGGWYMNFL